MRLIFDELPNLQSDVMQKWKRGKYRQLWADLVEIAVRDSGDRPKEPWSMAGVVCIRYSTRAPDRDNLAISFKPLLDGLIKAGVIEDDAPRNLPIQSYRWEKAPRKASRVEVFVAPVHHGAPLPGVLACALPLGGCSQCGGVAV